jgi:hypothetical protein
MDVGNGGVGEVSSVQDLLNRRLIRKYVTTGDLAAVALLRGWAREVKLYSNGVILHIEGKFYFDPTYYVSGFWFLRPRRRKFYKALPLVAEGVWALDDKTYVRVGQEITVVIDGKTYISRPNVCGIAESIGARQDVDVVVHVVGSLRGLSGVYYTAFRCSEWILPFVREPMFDRFAFDKRGLKNDITGKPILFVDIFVKKGRIVKVLTNPSCEEYVRTVYRLYGSFVECKSG